LCSQDYYLEFEGTATDLREIEKYNIDKQSNDSLILFNQVIGLHQNLQEQGYWSVIVDPNWKDSSHLIVNIQLGDRFQWLKLAPGNVDAVMLQKVGYKQKLYLGKPFHYLEVSLLMKKLIQFSGDSGYPFASVKLDSVQIHDTEISARLAYDSGPHITFDSVVLTEPVKINPRFLQAYLKIQPGASFSETLIEELPDRINKLPYLRITEEPLLTFQNDQASTYLSLQPIKANQIDGVIGFLPNAKEEGGLLLTGQFNLLLQNMFGSGRSLGLQWESFKPESQLLNINFYQPILFKSPIDLDLKFKLFKEDSTFVNRSFNLDLGYSYRRHFVGVYTHLKNARLPSSSLLEDINTFPDLADFNLNQFGGAYRWENLDDYLAPRTGLRISTRASTGTKKIKKNSAISDSLYQDLELESNQFSWEAELQGFIPLSKHWIIAGKWSGGGVYNNRLFFNDLFRLGGLKSLRGFSENTFFADNFAYSSIEPRFFFETSSYLFVFYDQAWWLRYSLENNSFKDHPSGFGAGISLTTNAGIFNFVWAVGSSKIQKIGFDQSKIHFGYISRF
jgi:outer membrane protein assembly factor BamA